MSVTEKVELYKFDEEKYLKEGDAIYYNSGRAHGMIATGGEDCKFLAVVIKNQ